MNSEGTVKPNLFLSHAWEDKDDFVRPLAEALRQEFDVWYDEYALKPGDSLLQKISAGLRNCDRGIVVFSHNFFGKQWTQAELNGLFALETSERKILIPIWLGVTKQDVLNFSPILADLVAIKASDGIPGVVSQIRGVVLGETQTREILGNTVSQRFKRLGNLVALLTRQQELDRSPDGFRFIKDQVKAIFDYFEQKADELQQHLTISRGRDDNDVVPYAMVHGPHNLTLRLDLTHLSLGNASASRLGVRFFRAVINDFGNFQRADRLEDVEFRPEFTENSAVDWRLVGAESPGHGMAFGESGRIQTGKRIVEDAFVRFADILEEELNGRRHAPRSWSDYR